MFRAMAPVTMDDDVSIDGRCNIQIFRLVASAIDGYLMLLPAR